MGNFAVAASDEIIRQGNELLNELSKDGVKKEIALSRLFELARSGFPQDTPGSRNPSLPPWIPEL